MVGGGAAGGFLSRAFELMLRECSAKKYIALQTAVKTYLVKQKVALDLQKNGAEHNSAAILPIDHVVERAGKQVGKSSTIIAALASAGHVLDGTDSKLVLNPLRLAFDTKNVKVVELALEKFDV